MKRAMRSLAIVAAAGLTAVLVAAALVGCGSKSAADATVRPPVNSITDARAAGSPAEAGKGTAAMEKAAAAKKYLFALFAKEENAQTSAMRGVLEDAIKEIADRADSVEVNVTSPAERDLVEKFGLDRAPMPLILALAPNGAVMGGFPTRVEKEQLLQAFASPCAEQCMKLIQKNRLVLLCVQNAATESAEAAMEGVRQFKADARFAQATEIVMLDPADAAEADFLRDLQIDPQTKEAVTVFLAPPGTPLAKYKGATSKDELAATLLKAASACGPGGCGPSGCPPK